MTSTTSRQARLVADPVFEAQQRAIRRTALLLLSLAAVLLASGTAGVTCYLVH